MVDQALNTVVLPVSPTVEERLATLVAFVRDHRPDMLSAQPFPAVGLPVSGSRTAGTLVVGHAPRPQSRAASTGAADRTVVRQRLQRDCFCRSPLVGQHGEDRLVAASARSLAAEQRLAIRQSHGAPLAADLEAWMLFARGKMSRHAEVAQVMDYMLKRWDTFGRFLADGRICFSNNAVERALRGVALGRKSWLFCGSDRGGDRAAAIYSLIITAKLNDVDPRAWLADVLRRIAGHPA